MVNTTTAIVLPTTFKFDGTTSDLAQQFYRRSLAGDVAEKLTLTNSTLPDIIQKRLTANGLQFDQLSGLLQRALVWDSGFGINQGTQLVQILTKKGVSMADIAVSKEDYLSGDCFMQTCTQPDGLLWSKSTDCFHTSVVNMAKCLVGYFDGAQETKLGIWSTGGTDTAIPELVMKNHMWTMDDGKNLQATAIHTAKASSEADTNFCEGTDKSRGVGAIVISCASSTQNAITSDWQPPVQGSIVTQWLKEYAEKKTYLEGASGDGSVPPATVTPAPTPVPTPAPTEKAFSVALLVPIILGVLVVLSLVVWFCRRKKRREEEAKSAEADFPVEFGRFRTPSASGCQDGNSRTSTGTRTNSTTGVNTQQALSGEATKSVTKILQTDANLVGKRLVFNRIEFDELVSNGAYGEVWVCQYEGHVVAVKRLLQKKHRSPEHIHDFAQEIQLSASLHHPHIVSFIGVAWDSLENLCMVLEYLPCGDLQTYLRSHGDLLSWPREKIHMALGMASALVYMHARTPVLIHRDLKSRNVLLSNNLETKIIDFGVSKGKRDETMTAGVGTPFWTAPEVLEGTRYSEKSDIYSFGVMLTELDTCKMPYHDAVRSDGEKLLQFQILNNVMTRDLRPTCTPDCPARVRKAVAVCLQQDPAQRPSALELLRMLDGQ